MATATLTATAKVLLKVFVAVLLVIAFIGGIVLGLLEALHFLALIFGVTRPLALLRHPAHHWFTIALTVSAIFSFGGIFWGTIRTLWKWPRVFLFLAWKRFRRSEQVEAESPSA